MSNQSISLDASWALHDLRMILADNASMGPDRRERIATAALQGMLAYHSAGAVDFKKEHAEAAVQLADALIAELDKPR